MAEYIYQHTDWPEFFWNNDRVISLLSEARNLQGRLTGKMESLGFELRDEALLDTLTLDVIKSSEIEGEILNPATVRSSIAKRLGIAYAGIPIHERNVDGMVDMMIDATQNCFLPLTKERLFDWHAALFPTGRSGMFKITVADWRKDKMGKMQVISGAVGRETIHFQAPDAEVLEAEMSAFINWFNENQDVDLVIKSAVTHLWFVTLHPFQDGNGRISRAITDMLLARSDNSTQRFYSMSSQIRLERKTYYAMLEKTQKGGLDISDWILWFLNCLIIALKTSEITLNKIFTKAKFWKLQENINFNERQKKVLNRLMDGFEGNLTSVKWAKIGKCSKDTAIRDINDLIEKGILKKLDAGGRSTNYGLVLK
jgi:Fic family protein